MARMVEYLDIILCWRPCQLKLVDIRDGDVVVVKGCGWMERGQ